MYDYLVIRGQREHKGSFREYPNKGVVSIEQTTQNNNWAFSPLTLPFLNTDLC